MLSVRCGPFHPELENAFVERLSALAPAPGRPVAVVAPSRRMADRLQRLAAVENGMSLLGVHFHTFHSLALALAEEGGFPELRLVSDPVFHDRVIEILLEERREFSALFGGGPRPKALAGALRSSLRDLIDAGVSAASLDEHFGAELLPSSRERERLSALLRLSQAYEERLEAIGVLAPSALVRLAARRAEDSALLRGFKEILYYGFYDLTGLQLDFFEAVVSRHPATLFFPYRRGHPAFRFADDFFEQKLLGHETSELPPAGTRPALGGALDRLFTSAEPPAGVAGGALFLINASGARDEVWAAAKEILRLVEGGVCRFDEIGLVARTLEPYREALAQVLGENAIPFDAPSGEPLLRHPLAKASLNLLTLGRRDFPAAMVEDLFSSPYFKGGPGFGPRTVFHWREAIRRLGIHAGSLQWRGKLERRGREGLELHPERVREGGEGYAIPPEDLRALWLLVLGLEKELSGEERSWSSLARRAREVLDARLAPPAGAEAAERAAWEAVLEALSSLEGFDRLGTRPGWDEFLDCLEEKLERATLEAGPGPRGVRVRGAMDARGESFRVLFLLGLKEKLFPRQVREDPLLKDGVRAALRHPAGYWIARKASGTEEERLLFYLMVSSASERLYGVYPRSDEDGKAEVPSLYLRELCRAAGTPMADEQANRRVPRGPSEKIRLWEPSLLSPREVSLRLAQAGRSPGGYLASTGRDGRLLDLALARVADLNARGKPGPLDGFVPPPREFLGRLLARGVSPSALESFARCPFQFFADRVLALGRREEAAEKGEFGPRARGLIYHAVLQRFYAGLPQGFWGDPRGGWESRLGAALDEVFREFDWRELGLYPVLWLSARSAMTAHLRRFLAWDLEGLRESGFRPRWLERSLEGRLPGRLPQALEGLKMRGIVDRVDLGASGRCRVVDYKSRLRPGRALASLIAGGEMHQLPMYAELVSQAQEGRASIQEACLYGLEDAPETTGGPRALVYEGARWEQDREAFFERVAAELEEIAGGRYPIRPEDGEFGHCAFCEFSRLCRKNHAPSRGRAAKTAAA